LKPFGGIAEEDAAASQLHPPTWASAASPVAPASRERESQLQSLRAIEMRALGASVIIGNINGGIKRKQGVCSNSLAGGWAAWHAPAAGGVLQHASPLASYLIQHPLVLSLLLHLRRAASCHVTTGCELESG
jgi:hypothetical protein